MPLKDYIYWIDANMPPKAANWLRDHFGVSAEHVFYLDILSAEDNVIFDKAKDIGNVIIITKDEDFIEFVLRIKPPPKVIWITAGNISNEQLRNILLTYLEEAVGKLDIPEHFFVEIR